MSRLSIAGLFLTALVAASCDQGSAPQPSGGTCSFGGKSYQRGESFPSPDGCNTCTCTDRGTVACTERGCSSNKRCMVGGCSGQLCVDEPVASTCEWREEYACYKQATCERQADGRCGWTQTPALQACLAGAKK